MLLATAPLMAMERALQAAQQGNFSFIQSMPSSELNQLLSKTDEDGRSLVHAAAARYKSPQHAQAMRVDSLLTHRTACSGHAELVSYLLSNGGERCVAQQDDEVPLPALLQARWCSC